MSRSEWANVITGAILGGAIVHLSWRLSRRVEKWRKK